MTTADRLREEGRVEGGVETLLKLLRLRFGDVAPDAESRVRSASSTAQLDHWIERVLTAASVDEVLGPV